MILSLGVVPALLLLAGFPIYLVLLTGVTVAVVYFTGMPATLLHQNMFAAVSHVALLAVPFFIYADELMGRGSVAQRLVDVVQGAVRPVRGSLGVTTVGVSAVFGAISGVSAACVATVGRIMYPAMRREGYPDTVAVGLVTATGAIDTIIPPSVPMIIYGMAASASVPRLYAAGILPGLLIAAMLTAYIVWASWRSGYGQRQSFDFPAILRSLLRALWALGMPFIILGGIYGGVFSPTEAAAVACVYAGFVTTVIFRELGWRDIIQAASVTVHFSAQILLIVASASIFSWLITVNQIPANIVVWLSVYDFPVWALLLVINVMLLVVGCFVDPLSAILLLAPLLVPVVTAAGIDPIHFGIVFTVNLAIGLFTPPFGMNIFVAQSVLKVPLSVIYRGLTPFLIVYLVALAIITYVPELSLISMRMVMGH